jgi:putative SOS response-associated peptidase YedK
MPVILPPAAYALWLDPRVQPPDQWQPLLKPYPAAEMKGYAVSGLVSNPRHDSPACFDPAEEPGWF